MSDEGQRHRDFFQATLQAYPALAAATACPGSGIPVARGGSVECTCGVTFEIVAGVIPVHTQPRGDLR